MGYAPRRTIYTYLQVSKHEERTGEDDAEKKRTEVGGVEGLRVTAMMTSGEGGVAVTDVEAVVERERKVGAAGLAEDGH